MALPKIAVLGFFCGGFSGSCERLVDVIAGSESLDFGGEGDSAAFQDQLDQPGNSSGPDHSFFHADLEIFRRSGIKLLKRKQIPSLGSYPNRVSSRSHGTESVVLPQKYPFEILRFLLGSEDGYFQHGNYPP